MVNFLTSDRLNTTVDINGLYIPLHWITLPYQKREGLWLNTFSLRMNIYSPTCFNINKICLLESLCWNKILIFLILRSRTTCIPTFNPTFQSRYLFKVALLPERKIEISFRISYVIALILYRFWNWKNYLNRTYGCRDIECQIPGNQQLWQQLSFYFLNPVANMAANYVCIE